MTAAEVQGFRNDLDNARYTVREAARLRHGEAFDLKAWHMHALRLGPMGLDPFEAEMAGY